MTRSMCQIERDPRSASIWIQLDMRRIGARHLCGHCGTRRNLALIFKALVLFVYLLHDSICCALNKCQEEMSMNALIDNGFLTDMCLNSRGEDVRCKGVLKVQYYSKRDRHDRKLCCHGVPEKSRHRFHWFIRSVFQGHHRLDAADVCGVVQCFGAGKSVEIASQDTGLYRNCRRAVRQAAHRRHIAGPAAER